MARHASLPPRPPRWPVGVLPLLVVFVAALAEGATREITLKEPNPFFRETALIWANLALVLLAAGQALRTVLARRNKLKAVAPGTPPRVALASAPSAKKPAPAPSPAAPRSVPVAAAPTSARVTCASCQQALALQVSKRPMRFRCPKCQTIGVLA